MYPKSRKKIQSLNSGLKNKQWETFQSVIRLLCQVHEKWPFASTISGYIRNRDVMGLISYADLLSSQLYDNAAEHFAANQFASLIRKYPFPPDLHSLDPRGEALRKFWKSERKCARINQRFRCYLKRSPYENQMAGMRSYIAYVLGDAPRLPQIWNECGFGPGASVGIHGNATNDAVKLAAKRWSVSPSALYYGAAAMKTHQQMFELVCSDGLADGAFYSHDPDLFNQNYARRASLCTYNKISFVPKTAATFRSIAVEPLVNSWLQKGVDVEMRQMLARVGIDLSDQSINCEFARLGSLDATTESYVTLDLSSASDSISIGLVKALLPPDWFEFLNAIRSKDFLLDGVVYTYSKFCSMGNGFCFPLQSLLFSAACKIVGAGTAGRDFHVYGDDIVIKQKYAENLIAFLRVLGFSLNRDKSFISGPFRESCGRDWFNGIDVRPFTLDFALDSLQGLFKFLNLSRRNELSRAFFEESRQIITDLIPLDFRYLRPEQGNADTGIDVELDEFMSSPHCRWNKSLQCWSWLELSSTPVEFSDWRSWIRRDLYLTYGVLRGADSLAPFAVRRKTRTRVRRVAHSQAVVNSTVWLTSSDSFDDVFHLVTPPIIWVR